MALAPAVPGPALPPSTSKPQGRLFRHARDLLEPQLSVVIVNYDQWESTARSARQILRTAAGRRGGVEVVIVDNHSPPHPLVRRLRRWPGVSVRRWGRNRGFARAANEGARLSRGRWLLLLNPDVTLPTGFVERALQLGKELCRSEPRTGIVGYRLCNEDGSPQGSAGSFPTLLGTILGLARPRAWRKYRAVPQHAPGRVPWVTGCCLLIRRDCWQQLKGFDRRYFLYYEDVDLCRRARANGWSVWHEPRLTAIHRLPLHDRSVPPGLRCITRHALLTYARKHWPWWQFRLLAGIVRAESWARSTLSRSRGDAASALQFAELVRIAADIESGQISGAQRRLRRLIPEFSSPQPAAPAKG